MTAPALSKEELEEIEKAANAAAEISCVQRSSSPTRTVATRRSIKDSKCPRRRSTKITVRKVSDVGSDSNNERLAGINGKRPTFCGNNNSMSSTSQTSTESRKRSPTRTTSNGSSVSTGSGSKRDRQKSSRPGSVSPFLKSMHRQCKADIAKIQEKMTFL